MSNDVLRNGCPTLQALPAPKALDTFYLEARCKLLDLAAILDRIGRGTGSAGVADDPRLVKIREALEMLHNEKAGRAERLQQLFSLSYDSQWERPKPR